MTVQYFNINVGVKQTNGDYVATHKGRSTAQSGHVSVVYDDAVITGQNQLLAALRQAILIVQSDAVLPKG